MQCDPFFGGEGAFIGTLNHGLRGGASIDSDERSSKGEIWEDCGYNINKC